MNEVENNIPSSSSSFFFFFFFFGVFFDTYQRTFVFTPAQPYPRSTTLTVKVPPHIKSIYGETLSTKQVTSYSFTTLNIYLKTVAPATGSRITSNQVFFVLFDLVCGEELRGRGRGRPTKIGLIFRSRSRLCRRTFSNVRASSRRCPSEGRRTSHLSWFLTVRHSSILYPFPIIYFILYYIKIFLL